MLHPFLASLDNDNNFRLTFAEDNVTQNVDERKKYVSAIQKLETLLNSEHLPESLSDLRGKQLRIGYTPDAKEDNYLFNVLNSSGKAEIATVCYLGMAREAEVEHLFKILQSLFAKSHRSREKVVVFYQHGDDIIPYYDKNAGKITHVVSREEGSILT
ncbi:hypothetical protein MKQ70_32695 [Chitinophaga sedimenti]|uniref:hypothetical protein n=1 Tax=Chitinophaga sedimenti TaxID=2033606 RepID=UPI002003EAE1|nr:hypothetical protein [Chitinophaga sedimenti]MCK7559475.1 hypothetical protein [Chitinophaga sedimenti]